MATQRASFAKLQRERDKKAKAAAKRERRQDRDPAAPEEDDTSVLEGDGELSAAELLKAIELVHKQFENKEIDDDEFQEKKADLLARLPID